MKPMTVGLLPSGLFQISSEKMYHFKMCCLNGISDLKMSKVGLPFNLDIKSKNSYCLQNKYVESQ